MTDNERISKWLGECLSTSTVNRFGKRCCIDCGREIEYGYCYNYLKDYDSDPSAWTPALYQKIEDADLEEPFVHELRIINDHTLDDKLSNMRIWELLKATPQQKAQALSRAIEEMEARS